MPTLYVNGRIFTARADEPFAEALLVDGAAIVFVGAESKARACARGDVEVVDLAGRMLMPGIHDAHTPPRQWHQVARRDEAHADGRRRHDRR